MSEKIKEVVTKYVVPAMKLAIAIVCCCVGLSIFVKLVWPVVSELIEEIYDVFYMLDWDCLIKIGWLTFVGAIVLIWIRNNVLK